MPPWALVHCTNACRPYVGPTNARGSNGLVLLAIVPIVIVVAVTPVSDATLLLLPPPPAGPTPGPLSPPAPVDGPVPGLLLPPPTLPPGVVLTPGSGSPDGPVTCGTPCCWAWTNALSGSRVPQAASTRLDAASAHSTGLDGIDGFSHLTFSGCGPRPGRTGRGAAA